MKHANDNLTPEQKQAYVNMYLNDLYDNTMSQSTVRKRSIYELAQKLNRIHLKVIK